MDRSGLAHLRFTEIPQPNTALISAFVERWSPETNTFHMPFGEMTITLHDVMEIMGLKCLGLPVRFPRVEMSHLTLEGVLLPVLVGNTYYNLGDLRQHLLDQTNQMTLGQRASTYMMYLMAVTLFVDKSQDKVSCTYARMVADVGRISEYVWGTAALAFLYRELGKASRQGCKQMGGSMTLLQVHSPSGVIC